LTNVYSYGDATIGDPKIWFSNPYVYIGFTRNGYDATVQIDCKIARK